MVEQMVENIRTSENLSPNELERLRSMLPEGWAANNRQKNASGMTQLEVILDAIDYIKTLQEKLKGGRKWKGQGFFNIEGCDRKKERVI